MEINTFVNLANINKFIEYKYYEEFDNINSDGIFLTLLINLFTTKKIIRKSFDMGSIASKIIYDENYSKVLFCGGTIDEIKNFESNIKSSNLQQFIFLDGYDGKEKLIKVIKSIKPNLVILSLGFKIQEEWAIRIKKKFDRNDITIYTSGAFISQSSQRTEYYPTLINKYNLRWLYRAYSNKHVRRRLLIDYPMNTLRFILIKSFREKVLKIIT